MEAASVLMQRSGRTKKRGFNLIEAAIVLGVVGLVVGGIWVAAAHFYEEYKVNKTVEDLQLIVRNVQGLISIRDAEAIGNQVNIGSTIIQAGMLPTDWINGGIVKSPLGGNVEFWNKTNGLETRFFAVTTAVCIKLITRVGNIQKLSGQYGNNTQLAGRLNYIAIYDGPGFSWVATNFDNGISQAAVTAACNGPIAFIAFTYNLTRIN